MGWRPFRGQGLGPDSRCGRWIVRGATGGPLTGIGTAVGTTGARIGGPLTGIGTAVQTTGTARWMQAGVVAGETGTGTGTGTETFGPVVLLAVALTTIVAEVMTVDWTTTAASAMMTGTGGPADRLAANWMIGTGGQMTGTGVRWTGTTVAALGIGTGDPADLLVAGSTTVVALEIGTAAPTTETAAPTTGTTAPAGLPTGVLTTGTAAPTTGTAVPAGLPTGGLTTTAAAPAGMDGRARTAPSHDQTYQRWVQVRRLGWVQAAGRLVPRSSTPAILRKAELCGTTKSRSCLQPSTR